MVRQVHEVLQALMGVLEYLTRHESSSGNTTSR